MTSEWLAAMNYYVESAYRAVNCADSFDTSTVPAMLFRLHISTLKRKAQVSFAAKSSQPT